MNINDYRPVESCQIPRLEEFLAEHLGLINDGTFVEVGAFDGKTYSNTYQLAQLGWTGLYIEPMPHLVISCRENHKNHPNISIEQAFVSDVDDEIITMCKWGDNTYTGNFDFIKYVSKFAVTELFEIKAVTLNTLFEEYKIPLHFHLLVIDVEGHEIQVLQGLDLQLYKPTMIIIETHAESPDFGLSLHADDIDAYLRFSGYRLIFADAINSIYVACDV